MKRGNLVIYDATGKIFAESGETEGDLVQPHVTPVGIPYMEIPHGTMAIKRLISINTTTDPHEPIFEDIPQVQTPEERIQELENQLLLVEGVI